MLCGLWVRKGEEVERKGGGSGMRVKGTSLKGEGGEWEGPFSGLWYVEGEGDELKGGRKWEGYF